MKSCLAAILALAAVCSTALAQTAEPTWLRYPAISPDGARSSSPTRATCTACPPRAAPPSRSRAHAAQDFMPVWSHDGRQIAFASDRYGNFDVFVDAGQGGEPRRLTFHSAAEYPYTFRPATGRSSSARPARTRRPTAGSRPARSPSCTAWRRPAGASLQVLTTPAEDVQVSARRGAPDLPRQEGRRERVAEASHLVDRPGHLGLRRDGRYAPQGDRLRRRGPQPRVHRRRQGVLLPERGERHVQRAPHGLAGRRVGAAHLASAAPGALPRRGRTPDPLLRLRRARSTRRAERPSPGRWPSPIAADAKANNERVMAVTGGAPARWPSRPSGKEVAFIVRGDVFVTSVEGGVTKQISRTPEQEGGVEFSPDGKALLYASERGGRWRDHRGAARARRRSRTSTPPRCVTRDARWSATSTRTTSRVYSPDGKRDRLHRGPQHAAGATTSRRSRRGRCSRARSMFSNRDADQYFQWSPDGRWMLFDYVRPRARARRGGDGRRRTAAARW